MSFYLDTNRGDGTPVEIVQVALNSYSIIEGELTWIVHKPDLMLYLVKLQQELSRALNPNYEAYVNTVKDIKND